MIILNFIVHIHVIYTSMSTNNCLCIYIKASCLCLNKDCFRVLVTKSFIFFFTLCRSFQICIPWVQSYSIIVILLRSCLKGSNQIKTNLSLSLFPLMGKCEWYLFLFEFDSFVPHKNWMKRQDFEDQNRTSVDLGEPARH